MSAIASAPGKVILFGEHAVVYGRPAIAVPVTQVQATAAIAPAPPGSGLTIVASDLKKSIALSSAPEDEPLAAAARLTLDHLAVPIPDAAVTIHSTIPIASGLGSGAAVSTALVRALASFSGSTLSAEEISTLVFEVEKIHHGTPSGIDNTVIAYEQPVYFVRKQQMSKKVRLNIGAPFTLLIADTGKSSPTKRVVGRVRRAWQRQKARYEVLFDQMGDIVDEARRAMEAGDTSALGSLMNENHDLLIALGVSSPKLDELVDAAHFAGALGAKLSGAGQGGNMIALVEEEFADEVMEELKEAGAARVICTRVQQRN
jgi:mevalonate kinase